MVREERSLGHEQTETTYSTAEFTVYVSFLVYRPILMLIFNDHMARHYIQGLIGREIDTSHDTSTNTSCSLLLS